MKTKHIFVTGGVVSGLGKGITAASLGLLLKSRGYVVTMQKLDLYLNVDLRQMSPYQHGEVFVTTDGRETDLDIGHYERFINENMSQSANITSGQIYSSVIGKERAGDYKGETVQLIPHLTNEIMDHIYAAGNEDTDFIITEIGGTVGDIEGLPFIEAIRQVAIDKGKENVLYIHVTLVPYIQSSGELKTKPTQHAVKELLSFGIQPDIVVCRSDRPLNEDIKRKIALFCNLKEDYVIENRDAASIYEVPLLLEAERLAELVLGKLKMENTPPQLDEWIAFISKQDTVNHQVTVGLVGDYISLHDAYLSVMEALHISAIDLHTQVDIEWISSTDLAQMTLEEAKALLEPLDGVLLSAHLEDNNTRGYTHALKIAKETMKPILATGYAFNLQGDLLLGKDAIEEITRPKKNGIRMGDFTLTLKEGSLAHSLYKQLETVERFWHKYEIKQSYYEQLDAEGMDLVGFADGFVELMELRDHPFFLLTQFEPAFLARPSRPHPIYQGFVTAMSRYQKQR